MISLCNLFSRLRLKLLVHLFPELMAEYLARDGVYLTEEQVAVLEKKLEKNPDDIRSRILLLGKYRAERDADARKLRHIEWIIRHRPQSPVAELPHMDVDHILEPANYERIKALWQEQIEQHKSNSVVLGNAAHFFYLSDKEAAEHLFLLALKLNPTDHDLRRSLSQLYSLWAGHENEALVQAQKVYDDRSGDRFYDLTPLPSRAFVAGKFDQAVSFANELLELAKTRRNDWNYGNAINKAHTVLGQVALQSGDLETARFHLAQSAINIGSPQTRSFGPSLDLATQLAAAGEKTAVIQYLDTFELLCGVANDRAFHLRYKIQSGHEPSSLTERENFEIAFLDHQFEALQARNMAERKKHLEQLIDRTESRLEIYLDRSGEAESEELSEYGQRTIKRLKEQLQRLSTLLPNA